MTLVSKGKSIQYLNNAKENIEKYNDDKTMQYSSNKDKLTDYSRQITEQSSEIFFDNLKLQRDYINAFQTRWYEYLKTTIDNYLEFQYKMIMLYPKSIMPISKRSLI